MSSHCRDVYIVGTDICKNQYGLFEHLCDSYVQLPHADAPQYCEMMETLIVREGVDAAIVLTEKESLNWSQRRYPTRYVVPPPRFCEIAINKLRVHESLMKYGIVPSFVVVDSRGAIDVARQFIESRGEAWIRAVDVGSTSALGALLVHDIEELRAWFVLNKRLRTLMLSEYLPGRNFACNLLYHDGQLVKYAIYERLEYFMGHLVPSGISGNISRGRLVNDSTVLSVSTLAVEGLVRLTGETMTGLVTVDLKGDKGGKPNVTEINLRHTACTSAFASGGANMAEAQVLAALGKFELIGPAETMFPPENLLLRDIDGPPIWVANARLQLDAGRTRTEFRDD